MKTNEKVREEAPGGASAERLVQRVRERYAGFAGSEGGCCGGTTTVKPHDVSSGLGYGKEDLSRVPEGADLGLGCGVPIPSLQLQPGETVLDLGSGGGLDAFLAVRHVGASGRVIGVDMTPEMIERARRNAAEAGLQNVEFRQGRLEALPVDDASVDAVTSNCVINLVPDKAAVFREVARVLRPGGRLVVSDIVLDGPLPEAVEQDLLAYVGCVAGAMQREEYFGALRRAGLDDVHVLKDVDFLLPGGGAEIPPDVAELLDRCGVEVSELAGKVRSVTYRAIKP